MTKINSSPMQTLLFSIAVFVGCALACQRPIAAQDHHFTEGPFDKAFLGTVGDYAIAVHLVRKGEHLQGEYLYTKYGQPIPLVGDMHKDGQVSLTELSAKGEKVAAFQGSFASSDEIKGTWSQMATRQTLPFQINAIPLKVYKESKPGWKLQLSQLPATGDVVVDLDYDAATYHAPVKVYQEDVVFIEPETGEHFLILPTHMPNRSSDRYSFFQARGSHWYGGTLVTITKGQKRYTLAYVGLKLSAKEAVRDLSAEVAVEFGNTPYKDQGSWMPPEGFLARFLARLMHLLASNAYACGPSMYVRHVRESKLLFLKEVEGIRWYRFATPVRLYDLPSEWCGPKGVKEVADYDGMSKSVAKEYCGQFRNGQVRMHIYYTPDNPGPLTAQIAGVVVQQAGQYYQATLQQGETNDTVVKILGHMYPLRAWCNA